MSRSQSPSGSYHKNELSHEHDRNHELNNHRGPTSPPRERERERSPVRYSRNSRSRSPPRREMRYHRGRSPYSRSPSPRNRGYHQHRRRSPDRYDDRRRYDRPHDDRSFERRPPPTNTRVRDDFARNRGNRTEHPDATPSCVLGVFGLSSSTTKDRLSEIFAPFGSVTQLDLIVDRYTNQSKGFGFVYFDDVETATRARESMNGEMVDGRRVRVDYSLTTKPHEPTPGRYMGRPDQQNDRRANHDRSHGHRENRRYDDRR